MAMLSTRLSTSTAVRAVRPSLLLKCVTARYGGDLAKRLAQQQGAELWHWRDSPARALQQRSFSSDRRNIHWGARTEFFNNESRLRSAGSNDFLHLDHEHQQHQQTIQYEIPQNVRQKVVSPKDAVALVRDGDTVCVSGFVAQGTPEAVLKSLGEKYEKTGSPNKLTLLFGGGPGTSGKERVFSLKCCILTFSIPGCCRGLGFAWTQSPCKDQGR
jgi:hypothetical protein